MIYALVTSDGRLVRQQQLDAAPILSAAKGLAWVPFREVHVTPATGETVDGFTEAMEGGEWVRRHKVRTMTYAERRRSLDPCYAHLTEQLDMQYKDTLDGGTRWVDHITAVKAAHPKPVV